MKKFFCVILTISLLLTFIACSSGETNTNPIETEEEAPHKSLTDDEKTIFDALKIAVFRFNSPSTVKITKATAINNYLHKNVNLYIEGTAKTGWYTLELENYEILYDYADMYYSIFQSNTPSTDIDVEKITNLLQEYVNDSQTIRPSAYTLMLGRERLVFDALIVNIHTFYNPSSVRILQAKQLRYVTDHKIDLLIQANNRMGGTLHDWYSLSCVSYQYTTQYVPKGTISKLSYTPSSEKDIYIDCSRINKALIEYWETQGI